MRRDIDIRQMQQRLAGAFSSQAAASTTSGEAPDARMIPSQQVVVDRENDLFRFY